jgi:hypothetical protein
VLTINSLVLVVTCHCLAQCDAQFALQSLLLFQLITCAGQFFCHVLVRCANLGQISVQMRNVLITCLDCRALFNNLALHLGNLRCQARVVIVCAAELFVDLPNLVIEVVGVALGDDALLFNEFDGLAQRLHLARQVLHVALSIEHGALQQLCLVLRPLQRGQLQQHFLARLVQFAVQLRVQ